MKKEYFAVFLKDIWSRANSVEIREAAWRCILNQMSSDACRGVRTAEAVLLAGGYDTEPKERAQFVDNLESPMCFSVYW